MNLISNHIHVVNHYKKHPYFTINPEVEDGLRNNRPVVALESTIIAHGMPYPANVETAKILENVVRKYGALPATIAIINGKIKVGLSENELQILGSSPEVIKCSRRDIPYIVSSGKTGATTVAATMIIAAMAGIRFFATGGIGGVHRGASETMDISADLQELTRTSVAVISSGVKSILDIGLTLEYLETHGVPVIGYQTDDFPAFYTRKSGFPVNYRIDGFQELVNFIRIKWEMGLSGGIVVANPIPEQYELEHNITRDAIDQALLEADMANIKGKEITPYLLKRIIEITSGESLTSNIELVKNNAIVAAQLALLWSDLQVKLRYP